MKKSCMNCKHKLVSAHYPPCDDCFVPGGPVDELPDWEPALCELCNLREFWTEMDGTLICGPCWNEKQEQLAWKFYQEVIGV